MAQGSLEEMQTIYDELSNRVASSLGGSWSRSHETPTRTRPVEMDFKNSNSGLQFEVYISLRRGVYTVGLDAQRIE
jgi:hypothetical protein